MVKLALQLYTIREELQKDFVKTLEEVANLGFEGVEFAGFYNIDAHVMKSNLDRLNLKAVASHTPYEHIVDKADEVINYNKIIGNKNIVCPYYDIKTKEDLDKIISGLKAIVDKYNQNGMELFYHNHDHEFIKFDNKYALDILLEKLDNKLKLELDTFWVYCANINVLEYMQNNKNMKLIHLKDGINRDTKALGEGNAPIKDIFEKAKQLGIEWAIVENDMPLPNGLEDVKRSVKYIKENLK
ncbi:TIM barrel protein [uncultured Tyzzerella sp.]|uniref:sugar phosphate isomerase/epimerase family protein n=1 Tax=uncultured Tyzzerella sp. TaxID=2321398 RepID=UPI002942B638|nr:TIM barrel protein [uncultured Tyzzerella sp.]